MTNLAEPADGTEEFQQRLIDNIQGGVIICQLDQVTGGSKTLYMSEGWTQLTGYTIELLEAEFGGDPMAIILPEDTEKTRLEYFEQTSRGRSYSVQYRLRHRDGHIVWAIDRGVFTRTTEGDIQNQSIITDITPLMESKEKVRMSEARLRIAIKASNAAVYELDAGSSTCLSLENAEVVFRAGAGEVIDWVEAVRARADHFTLADALRAWYHPDDVAQILDAHEALLRGEGSECEVRVRQPDHSYIWCKLHLASVGSEKDSTARVIGHLVNTDAQHRRTERLLLEAQSDALTGLYNKIAVRDLIGEALSDSPGPKNALLMLDVDNFKRVNDRLGHLFGDAVLMDVASKLKKLFRRSGIVGRIGGDEFVTFLPGASAEEAAASAAKICHAFRHTYSGEKSDYKISCSVGVALSDGSDSFEQLFRKADIALYQAKSKGKDQYAIYHSGPLGEAVSESPYEHAVDGDSGKLMIKERIFELLYGSVDFSGSINLILALLGQLLDAGRVYIFENSPDNATAHNIYEWCAEGVQADVPERRVLQVGKAGYFAQFDENGVFRCNNFASLPEGARKINETSGMRSTFQVAIQEEGIIRGFMGYGSMGDAIGLASEQADLMIFAAKVIGTFIIKKRTDESVKRYNKSKMDSLDVLPAGGLME